jgi:hypothetical protein
MNNEDFNMDDFFDKEGFDAADLQARIDEFHQRMRAEAMEEAYRFISEVGILFWIRKDMYVKNNRKIRILSKMIKYFTDLEEYEKCAYLYKGQLILEESQMEQEINNQFNTQKIN